MTEGILAREQLKQFVVLELCMEEVEKQGVVEGVVFAMEIPLREALVKDVAGVAAAVRTETGFIHEC